MDYVCCMEAVVLFRTTTEGCVIFQVKKLHMNYIVQNNFVYAYVWLITLFQIHAIMCQIPFVWNSKTKPGLQQPYQTFFHKYACFSSYMWDYKKEGPMKPESMSFCNILQIYSKSQEVNLALLPITKQTVDVRSILGIS